MDSKQQALQAHLNDLASAERWLDHLDAIADLPPSVRQTSTSLRQYIVRCRREAKHRPLAPAELIRRSEKVRGTCYAIWERMHPPD